VPLAKVVKTYRGIVTGLTEAFIIEEEVKNELIKKDSKSSEILKPVLRGRNIQPYQTNFEHSWLIATFPVLKLDIENYPAIKDYFTNFGKERLEQTGTQEGRKKTSYAWFETQDGISYWQEFEKPKIMYQVLQVKPCFIYDEQGFYCNNSMWIIPTEDKSLLGIFNSRMGWFLISQYCTAIQNGFQLIFDYFGKIPIPVGKEEQRQAIAQKVDEILACKKADAQADTQALEREIDALVYALYGLSEAEIAEVEAS
jgi:hypothetical protein